MSDIHGFDTEKSISNARAYGEVAGFEIDSLIKQKEISNRPKRMTHNTTPWPKSVGIASNSLILRDCEFSNSMVTGVTQSSKKDETNDKSIYSTKTILLLFSVFKRINSDLGTSHVTISVRSTLWDLKISEIIILPHYIRTNKTV